VLASRFGTADWNLTGRAPWTQISRAHHEGAPATRREARAHVADRHGKGCAAVRNRSVSAVEIWPLPSYVSLCVPKWTAYRAGFAVTRGFSARVAVRHSPCTEPVAEVPDAR
jgi:hypothetical protein